MEETCRADNNKKNDPPTHGNGHDTAEERRSETSPLFPSAPAAPQYNYATVGGFDDSISDDDDDEITVDHPVQQQQRTVGKNNNNNDEETAMNNSFNQNNDDDEEEASQSHNSQYHHSRSGSASSLFFAAAGILFTPEQVTETYEQVTETYEQVTETLQNVSDKVAVLAEDVAEAVETAATEVKDAFVEELVEVKDCFVGELQEADESNDQFYLMGMTLTRGLSLLPSDVVYVGNHHHHLHTNSNHNHHDSMTNNDTDDTIGTGGTYNNQLYHHSNQTTNFLHSLLPPSPESTSGDSTATSSEDTVYSEDEYSPLLSLDHKTTSTIQQQQQQPTTVKTTEPATPTKYFTDVEDCHHRHNIQQVYNQQDDVTKGDSSTLMNSDSAKAESSPAPVVTAVPWSAYMLLLSAILSLSSIGPLLNVQYDVDATLKITWRKSCTVIMLLPLALSAMYRDGFPRLGSRLQWFVFLLTSLCYAGQTIMYAWSLKYTSVGNATILGNAQAMILLIGKVFVGDRISVSEGTGAIVAFLGAVFCSRDSADAAAAAATESMTADPPSMSNVTLLGDFYAILSSVFGVFFITFAKRIRPQMDLSVFMFFVMAMGALHTLLFLALSGEELGRTITFDRDRLKGVFGWTNFTWDRLPVEIMIAVVCNVFGAMGYVRAMQYFSNLIILVAGLCEPVAAELIAVMLGVGVLPGWKGWLGNGLVMAGTVSVVYKPTTTSSSGTRTTVSTTKKEDPCTDPM